MLVGVIDLYYKNMSKSNHMSKDEFEIIPGVGQSIAADLRSLGLNSVAELRGQSPEHMYEQLMQQAGAHIDRCVLYVFRCAVYYASNKTHDPEKLKWWNWKDEKINR